MTMIRMNPLCKSTMTTIEFQNQIQKMWIFWFQRQITTTTINLQNQIQKMWIFLLKKC